MPYLSKILVAVIFIAVLIVTIAGLFVDLMDIDAAQYASISREMLENHQYLKLYDQGKDYLDKPPLIFWLSTLSFKLFGISTFAYKLPSFLFSLLGVYSTFKLGAKLYDRNTGILAALLLCSCQAFFLMNNDVRTDALLTANVTFACWQLLEFSATKKFVNLIAGFTGVALAMMSKGPIGAVVPAAALLSQFAYAGELKKLLWWHWYAGIAYTLMLLLPMLYGLYDQYGTEGPVFYFWTQSFGRITGQSRWQNDAGYLYFTYNYLWSFFPWSVLGVIAAFTFIFDVIKKIIGRTVNTKEAFSTGGFLFTVLALSFSHYKLPHYIFVVYPLSAISTAGFIYSQINSRRTNSIFIYLQWTLALFAFGLITVLVTYCFPMQSLLLWIITVALILCMIVLYLKSAGDLQKLFIPSAFAAIIINFLLNTHAYPFLLKFQSGTQLAKLAAEEHIENDQLYLNDYGSHAFMFCFQHIIPEREAEEIIEQAQQRTVWAIGSDELVREIESVGIKPTRIFEVNDYPITKVKKEFLNPATRSKVLSHKYLIQIKAD